MPGKPATILVIDRHPIMRTALCSTIAKESDMVAISASASKNTDVLPIAESLRPDLILLALGNPGEEEMNILLSLRECLPASAILALTSNEVAGQEKTALANGAQAVVSKSASREELLHSLRELRIWKFEQV